MKLPPQLVAETDLEQVVVRLPRSNTYRVGAGWWLALALLLVVGVAGVIWFGRFVLVLVLLGLAAGGGMWMVRLRALAGSLAGFFTITIRAHGLSIDEETWSWGEIDGVEWECVSPDTVLLVRLRDGGSRRYRCDRRDMDDPVGVTRRQRGWLEHEVSVRIEAAGGEAGVPRDLQGLRGEA